jgi:hypothetical protein
MRVKIGNYRQLWSARALENFWWKLRHKKSIYEYNETEADYWDEKVFKIADGIDYVFDKTINKFLSKRKRVVKVKLDPWDHWDAQHTLALIILPLLKVMKEKKHGAPNVDDEDVPEELHSTVDPRENDTDGKFFDRWTWVLDEMIFAFEHIVDEDWWTEFVFSGEHVDQDSINATNKRIDRGLMLFGKYYRSLWD